MRGVWAGPRGGRRSRAGAACGRAISGGRERAPPLLGRALRGAEALPSRCVAGDEDEIGGGGGLPGDGLALVEGEQAAVEALAHLDPGAGVGAAVGAGRNVQAAAGDAHGVIAGDDTLI